MKDNSAKEYEPLILGYARGHAGMAETVNQIKLLKQAGCQRIVFGEDRFLDCLDQLHAGDTLIACGNYAVPISLPEFVEFMHECESKGIGFCTLKEGDYVNADLSNPDTNPQMRIFDS